MNTHVLLALTKAPPPAFPCFISIIRLSCGGDFHRPCNKRVEHIIFQESCYVALLKSAFVDFILKTPLIVVPLKYMCSSIL
jgi:hypothetical protein